jgi:hypothetical protein
MIWSAMVVLYWSLAFIVGSAIPQVQTISGLVSAVCIMQVSSRVLQRLYIVLYVLILSLVHLHLPSPPRLWFPPPPVSALRRALPLAQTDALQMGKLRALSGLSLDGCARNVRLGNRNRGDVQDGEGDELWVHTTCLDQVTYVEEVSNSYARCYRNENKNFI